ncbi:unnamed protein product [Arctogadus glacialis]
MRWPVLVAVAVWCCVAEVRLQDPGFPLRLQDPGFPLRLQDPGFTLRLQDPGFTLRLQDPGFTLRLRGGGAAAGPRVLPEAAGPRVHPEAAGPRVPPEAVRPGAAPGRALHLRGVPLEPYLAQPPGRSVDPKRGLQKRDVNQYLTFMCCQIGCRKSDLSKLC